MSSNAAGPRPVPPPPRRLDLYDGYDMPIKRADAVRYFYLYALGGAYIDTDFECLQPFEGSKVPLDDRRATFGLQFGTMKRPDALANSFMAAPAGHPLFAYLISQLRGAAGAAHPLDATGPRFLTSRFHQFQALAGSAAAALPKPRGVRARRDAARAKVRGAGAKRRVDAASAAKVEIREVRKVELPTK